MPPPLPLAELGCRIMVCGPTNAGKSTLAVALGKKLNTQVFHLDLFRHLPNTDWVARSDAEFFALHDEAITGDAWIMDGNYTSLYPQRIKRATGIILISDNRFANFRRYVWRTLFQRQRAGGTGMKDSLKCEMVYWVLIGAPRSLPKKQAFLPTVGLPFVEARSMAEINALYRAWGLARPR